MFGSGIRMNRGESHYERPCCLEFVYMTHDNILRLLLFLLRLQVIREIDDDVCRLLNMSIIMTTLLYEVVVTGYNKIVPYKSECHVSEKR